MNVVAGASDFDGCRAMVVEGRDQIGVRLAVQRPEQQGLTVFNAEVQMNIELGK